ncbi:MAG TPA: glycosyltransferase [Burkholderiales bacterium]|jgi:tetratricopeptide (TPR) repeat protein|nr:glycosyltransferase [Burkholderiales bacterium]
MANDRANEVDALYAQGSAAFRAGRYADTCAAAEHAIGLEPNLPALHFLLGSARLEQNDFSAADAAFAACLARRPKYPMVLYAQARGAVSRARAGMMQGRQPARLARDPADTRRVSLVICSIGQEKFDAACVIYRALLADVPHEIIGIHDAKSLCEGYNRGIRRASGEIVVLSHDDVAMVSPDFAARLYAHLSKHDLVGIAGTTRLIGGNWMDAGWPHLHGQIGSQIHQPGKLVVTAYQVRGATVPGAQALDGAFLALRREAFERVQFDERTFDGWHLYDLDFVFSAHLAGLRTAICNDLCLIHNSIGAYDDRWEHYVQRFVQKHRARLALGDKAPPADPFWLEMSSLEEWLLVTEEMIARPVAG